MKPIRIVLADDHPLFREAIAKLLGDAPEFELVGEAADGKECVARALELRPDILLLDIAMPDINGEQVSRELRRLCPEIKIVALSGYTDQQFVRTLIRAGASAYVVKSASGRELIKALRCVMNGKRYLSPEVSDTAGKLRHDEAPRTGAAPAGILARREREVLRLVAEGHRSAAIAQQLNISVATVEAHRRNVLRKLRLRSVADLTRYALREGITFL